MMQFVAFLLLFGHFIVDTAQANFSLGALFEQVNIRNLKVNKPYLFVGEYLTVQCDLTQKQQAQGMTSDSISFGRHAINGSPTSLTAPTSMCFDESDIQRIDRGSALLNISSNLEMSGVYKCYSRPGCQETDKIGISDDVTVDYAPHEVTNFSCVVLNWDDEMQCSWKSPVTYVNAKDFITDLQYYTKANRHAQPCPVPQQNGCVWKNPFNFENDYTMVVTVTNGKRNASARITFPVHANHIIKPNPVDSLVATTSPERPGCVSLRWTHSKKYWGKVFRVKVGDIHDETCQDGDFKVLVNNTTSMAYEACDFPAYTHLQFSVEAYPVFPFDGYWSNPVCCNQWTPQEAPNSGPSIAKGSYIVISSLDAKEYDITFYWNPVDDSSRNGVIDRYLLKAKEGKTKTVSSNSLSSTLKMSSINMNPFKVSIYAHNVAGISKNPSRWFINPKNMKVPDEIQKSFVAKIENDNLILSWDSGKENMYEISVYWCYSPSQTGSCEKPLNWRHVVNVTSSQYVLPNLPDSHKYYSYGISAAKIDSNESSGIFWTQCLIRHTKLDPPTFSVDPLVSSVRVSWQRHVCSYQSGFLVKHYIINSCVKSECNDPKKVESKLLSASNTTHVIGNLQPGTEHLVSMEMLTEDGKRENASWVEVVPLKEKSKTDISLIVTIISTIVGATILVISVGVCGYYIRGRFEKMKKVMGKPLPINKPPTPPSPVELSSSSSSASSDSSTTILITNDGCNVRRIANDRHNTPQAPLLPMAPCPPLPTAKNSRPCTNNASSSDTSLSSDQTRPKTNVGSQPETCRVEIQGFANKAFESSNNRQDLNAINNQISDSDQRSLAAYHQITMMSSSGSSSSAETDLSSENVGADKQREMLPQMQAQQTAISGYVQNTGLIVAPCDSSSGPSEDYSRISKEPPIMVLKSDNGGIVHIEIPQPIKKGIATIQINDSTIQNTDYFPHINAPFGILSTNWENISPEDKSVIDSINENQATLYNENTFELPSQLNAGVYDQYQPIPDINQIHVSTNISQTPTLQTIPSPYLPNNTTYHMQEINEISENPLNRGINSNSLHSHDQQYSKSSISQGGDCSGNNKSVSNESMDIIINDYVTATDIPQRTYSDTEHYQYHSNELSPISQNKKYKTQGGEYSENKSVSGESMDIINNSYVTATDIPQIAYSDLEHSPTHSYELSPISQNNNYDYESSVENVSETTNNQLSSPHNTLYNPDYVQPMHPYDASHQEDLNTPMHPYDVSHQEDLNTPMHPYDVSHEEYLNTPMHPYDVSQEDLNTQPSTDRLDTFNLNIHELTADAPAIVGLTDYKEISFMMTGSNNSSV